MSTNGFYRVTGPRIEWLPAPKVSPDTARERELFPDGIPLRGPLTSAQAQWLKART